MSERLTRNFARHEFRCRCGECTPAVEVSTALLIVLEEVRERFGSPVIINSGIRCPAYNARVGGAEHSQHLYGRAADIVVVSSRPEAVADWLEARPYAALLGIGRYRTFTHVDTRGHAARWGQI